MIFIEEIFSINPELNNKMLYQLIFCLIKDHYKVKKDGTNSVVLSSADLLSATMWGADMPYAVTAGCANQKHMREIRRV